MSLVSRANDEIIVNDPQNPTAANNQYLASRFYRTASIENMPRILTGSVTRTIGDSASLYYPSSSEKCDSDRFHFAHHVPIGWHYQLLLEKGRFWPAPRLMQCLTFLAG